MYFSFFGSVVYLCHTFFFFLLLFTFCFLFLSLLFIHCIRFFVAAIRSLPLVKESEFPFEHIVSLEIGRNNSKSLKNWTFSQATFLFSTFENWKQKIKRNWAFANVWIEFVPFVCVTGIRAIAFCLTFLYAIVSRLLQVCFSCQFRWHHIFPGLLEQLEEPAKTGKHFIDTWLWHKDGKHIFSALWVYIAHD